MKTTLYCKNSRSDKVYVVEIVAATNGLYEVKFSYGKRGTSLVSGTKTMRPVMWSSALKVHNRLRDEKLGKGYRTGPEYRAPGSQPQLVRGFEDNEDLFDKIEGEGFDYFFTEYVSPSSILHPMLQMYVNDYVRTKAQIERVLRAHGWEG